MTLITREPHHYCTLPRLAPPGDVVRCTECGQHYVRRRGEWGYGSWWDDISPRKVRSLIRKYQRKQAAINKLTANGPYDPI
jgi:hypothetical protein